MIKDNLNKSWTTFFSGIFLIFLGIVLLIFENLKQIIALGTIILGAILVIASISKPNKPKNDTQLTNNDRSKKPCKNENKDILWNETDCQTLIERYDSRNSIHVTAIVAIIFGAFSILTVLKGEGNNLQNREVLYLIAVETIIFPLAIGYCLSRAIHYSACIEIIQARRSKLHHMDKIAVEEAKNKIPSLIKRVISCRQKLTENHKILKFVPFAYLLWFILILAVLYLPV